MLLLSIVGNYTMLLRNGFQWCNFHTNFHHRRLTLPQIQLHTTRKQRTRSSTKIEAYIFFEVRKISLTVSIFLSFWTRTVYGC